jgi:hypothetical protein
MKFGILTVLSIVVGPSPSSTCTAYLSSPTNNRLHTRTSRRNNSVFMHATPMNTSSDSASAFTEYMAKSHEEKLKALKDLETKKNAEIEVSEFVIHSIWMYMDVYYMDVYTYIYIYIYTYTYIHIHIYRFCSFFHELSHSFY